MATFFCSDPHAFHGNIMKYCRRLAFMTPADREAFLALEAAGGDLRSLRISDESVDNMNRGLAANINARVGPNDSSGASATGSSAVGRTTARNARWFRDQIQCRTVFFVWGNHDDRKIRDLFTATLRPGGDPGRGREDHAEPLPDADLERPAPRLGRVAQHPSLWARPRALSDASRGLPRARRRRLGGARCRLRRARLSGLVAGRDPRATAAPAGRPGGAEAGAAPIRPLSRTGTTRRRGPHV